MKSIDRYARLMLDHPLTPNFSEFRRAISIIADFIRQSNKAYNEDIEKASKGPYDPDPEELFEHVRQKYRSMPLDYKLSFEILSLLLDDYSNEVECKLNHESTIANLSECNFSFHDFSSLNFIFCNFNNSIFDNTNLTSANMSYTALTKARIQNSLARAANFSYSRLNHTVFHNTDISSAQFNNTKILDSKFECVEASIAFFKNSTIDHCQFNKVVANNFYFTESKIMGVEFVESKILSSVFEQSCLIGSVFKNTDIICRWKLKNVACGS